MKAYKARYHNGTVQLLEQPPKEIAEENSEVVVVFLSDESEKEARQIHAKDLLELAGIASLGGDAVRDKKTLYDR